MEPLTVLAGMVMLITTGVFEGMGKDLQKKLVSIIHEKFKSTGTESLLRNAESKPTEPNLAAVKSVLISQMIEDESFSKRLAELVEKFNSLGTVQQAIFDRTRAKKIEFDDISQKAKGSSVNQGVVISSEISDDVKFGNVTQEAN